jgi:hypothetical protein
LLSGFSASCGPNGSCEFEPQVDFLRAPVDEAIGILEPMLRDFTTGFMVKALTQFAN